MFTLVIGGAASGKSEFAEQLVCRLNGCRVYLATMRSEDEECAARIKKHRAARASRSFLTIECPTDLAGASIPAGSNVLLDCIGNLTANELFAPGGAGPDTVRSVLAGIDRILSACGNLTIVSNDVFGEDVRLYGEGTRVYLRALAEINLALAARCDAAAEITAGLCTPLKGGELLRRLYIVR